MKTKTIELPRLLLIAGLSVGVMCWTACGSEESADTTIDGVVDAAGDAADAAGDAANGAAGDAADAADAAIDAAAGTAAAAGEGTLSFEEGTWGWNIYNYMNTGSGSNTFNLDVPLGDDENAELSAEGGKQLDDLAAILTAYPEMTCEVQGHTTKAKNPVGAKTKQVWSQVKAKWVKEKLKARGADGNQINEKGYGDTMPLEGVDPADDSQKRVVVVFNK